MQTNTNTSEYSPVITPETTEQSETPLTAEPVKPRSKWGDDERLDSRAKTESIQVLVLSPGGAPYTQITGNNLDVMQTVVGGLITTFDTVIEDVEGIANDEALMDDLPLNRMFQPPARGSSAPSFWLVTALRSTLSDEEDEEIARCRAVFDEPLISAISI